MKSLSVVMLVVEEMAVSMAVTLAQWYRYVMTLEQLGHLRESYSVVL